MKKRMILLSMAAMLALGVPADNVVKKFIRNFEEVDTTYIEPHKYNFATMGQMTNSFEMYRIKSKEGQSIKFSPDLSTRVGPYFGYRWAFLGWTVDVNHLENSTNRRELDLSLYSSMIGADLFLRRTGTDYHISSCYLGRDIDGSSLRGERFDGINVRVVGLNAYYIMNHKKFSYPAAFSQSTRQLRSCGSPIIGVSYTRHSIDLDYNKLEDLVQRKLGDNVELDNSLMFDEVKYTDVSLSGGYGYNWVMVKNVLLSGSVMLSLAYKGAWGFMGDDSQGYDPDVSDFSFKSINFDATGRFGVVWNTGKMFLGANAIFHSFNYRNSRFSTTNIFGTVNTYFGFNFGLRKKYRRHKPE